MKIIIKGNVHNKTPILCFNYEGREVIMPLDRSDIDMSIEISEVRAQQIMNMCIDVLRDFKSQRLRKETENEGRIRFAGVDYS